MKKGLFALALGTFALGMSEYVMMSILPDLAATYGVTVPQASHFISAYALGVCVGAPVVAVALRNWPLKRILMLLMVVYVVGNVMFASSSNFAMGLVGRFVTGLPHGAFFGAGSIVASRLMPGRQTTAVALMTLGMTIANLVGIPVGSFVAINYSWRWIFYFNVLWGALTFGALWWGVRGVGSLQHTALAGEFRFLRHWAPWLLILATVLCQGGAFAMYTYVGPIMGYAGMTMKYMPLLMLVVGLGMCLGNYFSGVVSDRFTPQRTAFWVSLIMTGALAMTFFDAFNLWAAASTITVAATMLFALSSPMQLLLIEYSPGGELMGGAMVQVAFNFGNAVGAWAGGVPMAHGLAPQGASAVGAVMAAASVLVLALFMHPSGRKAPSA